MTDPHAARPEEAPMIELAALRAIVKQIGLHEIMLTSAYEGGNFGYQVAALRKPVNPKRWQYDNVPGTFSDTAVGAAIRWYCLPAPEVAHV